MYKYLFLGLFLLVFTSVNAQELNCSVTVNAEQIAVSNNKIFKTLENSLTEFMNQTQWTNIDFKEHERIKCGITFLLTEQSGPNSFTGTIQVQVSRPVFDSDYYSPILNHKDNSFTFKYTEFEPLNYNSNVYESNLVSVMSYYAHLILGVYTDTFSLEGGTEYFITASTIANQAQQSGSLGWESSRGKITRFTLVDQLLSSVNAPYREMIYKYHYEGMDTFFRNTKTSTKKMLDILLPLKEIYEDNPNNILIRIMMDTKSDEIVNIFKEDSSVDDSELISILKKVSSSNSKKWKQIN